MVSLADYVVWEKELELDDKNIVGEELSKLGEIAHNKILIFPSIVVTPFAFKFFQKENNLQIKIKHLLGTINFARHDSVSQVSVHIQNLITHSQIPREISERFFKLYEKLESKNTVLTAFYFQDQKLRNIEKWEDIKGEASILEKIRYSWAHLYSSKLLNSFSLDHNNHFSFSVCLKVSIKEEYSISGFVKTRGNKKDEYVIEAHSKVRFIYNKRNKKLEKGEILHPKYKDILQPKDIKTLIDYAEKVEKLFYFPQIFKWEKIDEKIYITSINHTNEGVLNLFEKDMIRTMTLNPGISIGRLNIIDEKSGKTSVLQDEILMLKTLDKKILPTLKKAKGIILEEKPDEEVIFMLKEMKIPSVIVDKRNLKNYARGDIISFNAATGQIQKGSMLVS